MSQSKEKKGFLNGFTLKCIAMATMLVDHVGAILYPYDVWMRYIGRLAFPIYCFLLVEGAIHTSNKSRYMVRLFLFALVSEIPFDLAFNGELVYFGHQNVFFTLFLGVLAITLLEKRVGKNGNIVAVPVILLLFLAELLRMDYGATGVAMILCLYFLYQQKYLKFVGLFFINTLFQGIQSIQFYASFSIIPLLCYNGKRGPKAKYLFYVFYPAHLFILYWINYRYGWRR
jgi:hypothetical protein